MGWNKGRASPVTIMGTADSCWGNYFVANETEQGNEELVCLNRSLTVPFPHLSLLPRLYPAPDFSASFISSAYLCIYMVVCYRFLLLSFGCCCAAVFFPCLKYSSYRAIPAVADGLSLGSENENTLFPTTPLAC